ncbi:MAG: hypothetical protein OXC09_13415 [Truepera sp.]|nr:hypothetical protein [Truepera sp.]
MHTARRERVGEFVRAAGEERGGDWQQRCPGRGGGPRLGGGRGQGGYPRAPPGYDELWTAGKVIYKLEPALAEGGELIIYAPHLAEVSQMHGKFIYEIGYHVIDLAEWDRFRHVPLGVIAHSTHVRGAGRYWRGVERPRAQVTLAARLGPETCERLGLGYRDPASIDLEAWRNREAEGILLVPEAGEILCRVGQP